MDLFEYQSDKAPDTSRPLAEKMRPRKLEEFVGQQHIVGKGTLIWNAIENDRIFSMILWGPPGCGKTTLARIIAGETRAHFVQISAVLSGVKEIRSIIDGARDRQNLYRKKTILFVDEIHRFNKAQQDAFLQHVENGLITLIGATTENPSFEVIPALMSRCRVITLKPLSPDDMALIIDRALKDKERGFGSYGFSMAHDAKNHLVELSDGDVRAVLNGLEIAASIIMSGQDTSKKTETGNISLHVLEKALQKKALLYDKDGEEHYNIISAFHKSLRGSDPDAAVYWMGRMLSGGEDPLYVARRMVRFASEDIGNADPYSLQVALSGMEAFRFIGFPEGELALAQVAAYLAAAPKSNSIYTAYKQVKEDIKKKGPLPVPLHIRNAPTKLMKDLEYGKGYKYAHDYNGAYVPQDYLPDGLKNRVYYKPSERGYEKTIKQRLDRWHSLKAKWRKKGEKKELDTE